MGKEQLGEIKNQLDRFMTPSNKPCLFREDAEWLIEQVERVQELEEVLEFYADENTYKDIEYKMIYMDGVPTEPPSGEPALIRLDEGAKAREVLKGLKK